MTFKPDPRDSPFPRTVTGARIDEVSQRRPSEETIAILKRGLAEANAKLGYVQGKQLEPGASAEQIAYFSEREASVRETVERATKALERHIASVAASRRKSGKLASFSQLTNAFLHTNPRGSESEYLHWLVQRGAEKSALPTGQTTICLDGRKIQQSSLKDYLCRARRRLNSAAKK